MLHKVGWAAVVTWLVCDGGELARPRGPVLLAHPAIVFAWTEPTSSSSQIELKVGLVAQAE